MSRICPVCSEPVIQRVPRDLTPQQRTTGTTLRHSHRDGTQLCPVMGRDGYEPAEPVTG